MLNYRFSRLEAELLARRARIDARGAKSTGLAPSAQV